MIGRKETEIDVTPKRNRSAGHAEKLVTGQRIPSAKHLLDRCTRMHRKEPRPLMLEMKRRITGTNEKYASFTETRVNANLEQSASLSTINTTDLT